MRILLNYWGIRQSYRRRRIRSKVQHLDITMISFQGVAIMLLVLSNKVKVKNRSFKSRSSSITSAKILKCNIYQFHLWKYIWINLVFPRISLKEGPFMELALITFTENMYRNKEDSTCLMQFNSINSKGWIYLLKIYCQWLIS
jgi:hypothetical protein